MGGKLRPIKSDTNLTTKLGTGYLMPKFQLLSWGGQAGKYFGFSHD